MLVARGEKGPRGRFFSSHTQGEIAREDLTGVCNITLEGGSGRREGREGGIEEGGGGRREGRETKGSERGGIERERGREGEKMKIH